MKFKIKPGELRHPIQITKTIKDKVENIPIQGIEVILKTRAKIVNTTGFQYFKQLEVNSRIVKTFYIRFPKNCDITEENQVVYKNRKYNIAHINNIEEANRYLELKCEEVS